MDGPKLKFMTNNNWCTMRYLKGSFNIDCAVKKNVSTGAVELDQKHDSNTLECGY